MLSRYDILQYNHQLVFADSEFAYPLDGGKKIIGLAIELRYRSAKGMNNKMKDVSCDDFFFCDSEY